MYTMNCRQTSTHKWRDHLEGIRYWYEGIFHIDKKCGRVHTKDTVLCLFFNG